MACALWAAAASAQTPSSPSSTSQQQPPEETRPATTTFFGDTGIWFVPTAEVTPDGRIALSGYRRGTNYIQGYTNVGDFAGTFAFGLKNRAEVFGSFLVDTRIDRDVIPLFTTDPNIGGVIDRYPRVNKQWTGDNVGDFYLGAKYNLWSQYRQNPAAIALRAIVKLPTGSSDNGVSTGKTDFSVDAIVSKETQSLVEVAAFGGYQWRGKPDGFDTPGGAFEWGAGLTFPSRNYVRFFGEINGVVPSSDTTVILTPTLLSTGGVTLPPSAIENLTRATIGITVQSKKGLFFGVGGSWNVPTKARDLKFTDDDQFGDYFDWQVRIGYHPGVKVFVPPPPPPPPPETCTDVVAVAVIDDCLPISTVHGSHAARTVRL